MMSGGTVGVMENFDILPMDIQEAPPPGRSMIDAQLDELLNSLERDQEVREKMQVLEVYQPPPAKQPKLKKVTNKAKQKKTAPSPIAQSVGYTSDGNSDIQSCDSNNVSPLGTTQVFSPTTSSDGGDDTISTSSKNGGVPWSEHPLPPCRICGDRASGFHYGANTCEACKVCTHTLNVLANGDRKFH